MNRFLINLNFLNDVVQSFIFWSLFVQFPSVVMFWPMVKLAISGFEVAVIILIMAPVIGSRKFLRDNIMKNRYTFSILTIFSLIGLLSFQTKFPFHRLLLHSIGLIMSIWRLLGKLWNMHPNIRIRQICSLSFGFFLFVSLRIFTNTLVSAFANNKWNIWIMIIGLIFSLMEFFIPQFDKEPEKSTSKLLNKNPFDLFWKARLHLEDHSKKLGCALGATIFLIQMIVSETTLPLRWIISGRENGGLFNIPDGSLAPFIIYPLISIGMICGISFVLILMTCYISIWISYRLHFFNVISFIFGLFLPMAALFSFRNWTAYFLCITFLVPYLIFLLAYLLYYCIRLGSKSGFLFCFTTAMTIYVALTVLAVWTTAYNFVPFGGTYAREHYDLMIIICVILIGAAMCSKSICFSNYQKMDISFKAFLEFIRIHLYLDLIGMSIMFIFIFTTTLIFSMRRMSERPTFNPELSCKSANSFPKISAAIWTVHFGYDNNGWPSFDRLASALNDTNVDVIGLLETDSNKGYFGGNDLAQNLANQLNYHVDFGPATRDHTWGCILLSRYPIIVSNHHLLPSPKGELAPAISASINYCGMPIEIVVVHMGNDGDKLDRELQANKLSNLLTRHEKKTMDNERLTIPAIFLGYVTSAPGSENYHKLTNAAEDIDPTDTDRWCEYILYKGLIRRSYGRITHGGLTDTEIQMAIFQLPNRQETIDGMFYKDSSWLSINQKQRISYRHNDTILEYRMNEKKFGKWKYSGHGYDAGKNHQFHMDTPKYFL